MKLWGCLKSGLIAALWFGSVGCAQATSSSPYETLRKLQSATRSNDWAAVYALLPAQARRDETLDQFKARMRSQEPELQALGELVTKAVDEQRHVVRSDVDLGLGGTVTVAHDGIRWVIPRAGFGVSVAGSVVEAIQLYRSALIRQNIGPLLGILSSRAAGSLRADMLYLIDALKDPASLSPSTDASRNEVLVPLPDGRKLRVVREDGSWRVDDLL